LANPGWSLKIENREAIDINKKYILISNHQSIIDIALLLQLRINFKWVSKIELAKVPFVGWVIWMNSHILVKRGDKQSIIQMAEACKNTLDKGISIFMFPEGTRAESGKIQSFKDGAFILARENNVSILPVILDGSGNALPGKGFWFSLDQVFTLRVLDEITTETIHALNHEELKEHTHQIMSEELINIRKANQS
jgi:1-acyl-sn-glycerol-3-phosphate acyltransferase